MYNIAAKGKKTGRSKGKRLDDTSASEFQPAPWISVYGRVPYEAAKRADAIRASAKTLDETVAQDNKVDYCFFSSLALHTQPDSLLYSLCETWQVGSAADVLASTHKSGITEASQSSEASWLTAAGGCM